METKRIITIEPKKEVICHYPLVYKDRWVVGVYEDIGLYPKHIYSKSFDTKKKAEDYKKKIHTQEIERKKE